MPGISDTAATDLVNLKQLPKDKRILDYVLHQLSENGGPERFELMSALFDMYRTSMGFDPMVLSKGRFKRVKSGDFRKMVLDIDHELGIIFSSDDYKQLIAKQSNYSSLFQNYLSLSDGLNAHPPLSMIHETESFENSLQQLEAYELQLTLYRQHHRFFEETKVTSAAEEFLQQYDNLVEKSRNHSRRIRAGFMLTWLEQEHLKGKSVTAKADQLLEELGILMTSEGNKFTRHELLLRIIRCGLITAWPSRKLEPYLSYAAENINDIIKYNPDSGLTLYETLAHYFAVKAETRIEWLSKIDALSKELGRDELRPYHRLIRAFNAADECDWNKTMVHLNEAEHLVHRVPGRNLFARNIWIQVCACKTLLFTIAQISSESTHALEEFTVLSRIAEDIGQHRHDNAVLGLELKGLQYFAFKDWESALPAFERACTYREDNKTSYSYITNEYLASLLKGKSKKSTSLKNAVKQLEDLKSPFYSKTCSELLNKATEFYSAAKPGKLSTQINS